MTLGEAGLLRVVTISAGALHRRSERLRLAALAERPDIALTVLAPTNPRSGDKQSATVDERAEAEAGPWGAPNGAAAAGGGGRRGIGEIAMIATPARRWAPGLVSGRFDTIPRLGATLSALRADVIHVHQEPGSLLALQAVRLRDKVAPGAAVVVESEQSDMSLTTGATTHLERHVLRRADALLVRHKVRLELSRAQGFTGHGEVLGFAVDRRVYHPGLRDGARAALGVSGFTLGYTGRLVPDSGLTDVLEAIAASRVVVNLLIRGDGPMRDEIIDRANSLDIGDRVRILAPHEAADDAIFLGALDALVVMRHAARRWREPFEHVIPEAQACGVPVIAAALSGLPTLVGAGGWIVGERDAGLLARLLHRLVARPEVVTRVAAAALEHITLHGSMDSVTQQMRRAFDIAIQVRRLSRAGTRHAGLNFPGMPESYRR